MRTTVIKWREEWRPCFGFSSYYEVSSYGRVRRSASAPQTTGTRPGKLVIPYGEQPMVSLSINCKTKKKLVSNLVCETWHGPRPTPQHQAAHWDGDATNNVPSNLRWATRAENEHDKIRHGRYNHAPCGSKHKDAKLHENDIPAIRKLIAAGLSYNEIGRKYKVDHSAIRSIARGRAWKHV